MILLMCIVLPTASFAEEGPRFSLSVSKTAPAVGEETEVEIKASQVKDMVAFELNLYFNPQLWDISAIQYSSSLAGFSSVTQQNLWSEGHFQAVYTKLSGAAGENGDVTLGKVKFKAKAKGADTVTLRSILVGQLGEPEDKFTKYTPNVQAQVVIRDGGAGGNNNGNNGNNGNSGNNGNNGNNGKGNGQTASGSQLQITASPDHDGVVQISVDPGNLKSVIDQVAGDRVTIAIQSDAEAKKVYVEIPMEQIRYATSKNVQMIGIDSGLATVYLNKDLFAREGSSASVLQFTVSQVDASSLPVAASAIVGNNPVYDFDLKLDGRSVSQFVGKEVAVEEPYTLQPGEKPGNIVIYYISTSGQLEVVKNAKYDPATGKVSFKPKHFSMYFPVHASVTFNDLSEAAWAKESIEALAARKAVNGVGNDSFRPNSDVSRAEFITMLVNLFDLADATVKSSLSDVHEQAWYYTPIATAEKLGIVEGKGDGTFGVDDKITRQDMAVMMYRAARSLGFGLKPTDPASRFNDQDDIVDYASEAVNIMQQAGILNGMSESVFAPQGFSTRAQAAAVLYRIFDKN